MKRIILCLLLVLLTGSIAWADTIYLKDGRKIEGDVLRFENGQFAIQVSNPRTRSGYEILYFGPQDIDRVVIDGRFEHNDRADNRADTNDRNDRRDQPSSQSEEKRVTVVLSDNWVDTGILLKRGQRIRVDASGTVYLGGRTASTPEGISHRDSKSPAPDAPEGALIGAIGEDRNAKVFTLEPMARFKPTKTANSI